jgi:hypothetical protein
MPYSKYSRKTTRHAIVQSDTTVISPPLRAIEVFTAGDLKVREAGSGTDFTLTFPAVAAGGGYPYVFEGNFDKVYDTGTTILDAALLGFKG